MAARAAHPPRLFQGEPGSVTGEVRGLPGDELRSDRDNSKEHPGTQASKR